MLAIANYERLISLGADALLKSKEDGYSPFHNACYAGNIHILTYLLDKCGCDSNEQDNNGFSPLHWCCRGGNDNRDAIDLLLSRGSKIDDKDLKGATPLHRASSVGCRDIVQRLIEKGANIYEKSYDGWNSCHWAAYSGNKDVIELLLGCSNRPYWRTRTRRDGPRCSYHHKRGMSNV
jgi:ankyrin repeat protein